MKNKCEKQLTIRLPLYQYTKLEKLSKDNDVSIATIVRWAIKDYIKE